MKPRVLRSKGCTPSRAPGPGRGWARFTGLNAVLAALHSAYEVAGGVGLPGQRVFGLSGSVGAHAVVVGGWIGTATGRSRRRPWALALLNGLGLAGAVAHFLAWPTRWRRALLLLTDGVEGLGGGWAPWYNPLLYLWGAAAVVAVGRETAAGERRWALLGMGALPAVAAASHAKHVWGRDEASPRPRWWNRALR